MSNWDEGMGKTLIDLLVEEGWVAKAMGYAKEVMAQDGFTSDEEEIIIAVAASIAGMSTRVVNKFEDAEHFKYVLAVLLGAWDLPEAAQDAAIERIYNMGQEIGDMAEAIVAARDN